MASIAPTQRVWFISGCSHGGLGRQIVEKALARNDLVIATARSLDTLKDLESDSCKIMQFDVTAELAVVQQKAAQALQFWQRVDVLVNNAGYGILGFTEEVSYDGYMRQFHINFFGHLNITNAFLPQMRKRKEGTIVFIGSRSSYRSHVPMMGPYAASKAALSAVADCLAAELAPFNIRVLNVVPGAMRTRTWNSTRLVDTSSQTIFTAAASAFPELGHKEPIVDYNTMREQCIGTLAQMKQKADQAGDPAKAADAIVDIVRAEGMGVKASHKEGWPIILTLGEDGERDVRQKCELVLKTLDEWSEVAMSIAP